MRLSPDAEPVYGMLLSSNGKPDRVIMPTDLSEHSRLQIADRAGITFGRRFGEGMSRNGDAHRYDHGTKGGHSPPYPAGIARTFEEFLDLRLKAPTDVDPTP